MSDDLDPRAAAANKRGSLQLHAEAPDYKAAELSFREALQFAPHFGSGYFSLGLALKGQGQLLEASRCFETAARHLPNDYRPRVSMGVLLLKKRKFKEATKWLQEAIALKPHYGEADVRLLLAEAYEGSGNLKKAVAEWRYITTMEPGYPSDDFPMVEARRKLQKYSL